MKNINAKYLIRRLEYKIFSNVKLSSVPASDEQIDVVIPIIKKDLTILPLCFEGIRRCVVNPIKKIYIVAPEEKEIVDFCYAHNVIYVNEKQVLGISPKDINLLIKDDNGNITDRSGWLFQQLLKLSGKIGTCDNYLCIDADHILIAPHTFISNKGIPVFYTSSEYHKAYYRNIERLIGISELSSLSYVAHKMIFNKQNLNSLHACIEKKNHKNWIEAIIASYDRKEGAGFSEFELYGNFVHNKILRPWKQYALTYKSLNTYDLLKNEYSRKYNSITFSAYNKE